MDRLTSPVAASREPPRRRTLAEFMADVRDEGSLVEWVAGEVVDHEPPTARHQQVAAFVFLLLHHFVEFFGRGNALIAPVGLLLAPAGPMRQPDVAVLLREHAERIRPGYVAGPADIVVEVVSPDSVHRDRVEKIDEYARGGVREYWVIDARDSHAGADFYVLDGVGGYRAAETDGAGVYRSEVLPGFWLRPAWLRANPLPEALLTFAEIAALPAAAVQALREARRRGPRPTDAAPE